MPSSRISFLATSGLFLVGAYQEILGDLKRNRLKELCRIFDLDDGGREKAVIVVSTPKMTGPVIRLAPRTAATLRATRSSRTPRLRSHRA